MYCLGLFWFSLGSGRLVIKFRSVCVCVVCVCVCVCLCVCLCACQLAMHSDVLDRDPQLS